MFAELRTERLLLRRMRPSDAGGYADLLSDPTTHPFITENGPIPASEIPARIAKNRDSRESVYWSMQSAGDFVGFIALHGAHQPTPFLSYAVVVDRRRQGFGAEGVEAVCRYAFIELGAQQIIARTHVGNVASARLLLSAGFGRHGTTRTPQGERIEYRCPPPSGSREPAREP